MGKYFVGAGIAVLSVGLATYAKAPDGLLKGMAPAAGSFDWRPYGLALAGALGVVAIAGATGLAK